MSNISYILTLVSATKYKQSKQYLHDLFFKSEWENIF